MPCTACGTSGRNKKTFEFKAALDLVKNCIKKGINIIPNSSKTDLELNDYILYGKSFIQLLRVFLF